MMQVNLQQYLLQNPKTHLIFDLDETLARLDIDWSMYRKQIWDKVASFDPLLAQEIPFEPWMSLVLTNKAIERHGEKARNNISSFVTMYETTHYNGYIPNTSLLTFMKENIDTYSFYLWTNNSTAVIQDFLIKESLRHVFKKIITHDVATYVKPNADGFLHIKEPNVPLSHYLFIGDNPHTDQRAAQNAGIDFFLIDYTF